MTPYPRFRGSAAGWSLDRWLEKRLCSFALGFYLSLQSCALDFCQECSVSFVAGWLLHIVFKKVLDPLSLAYREFRRCLNFHFSHHLLQILPPSSSFRPGWKTYFGLSWCFCRAGICDEALDLQPGHHNSPSEHLRPLFQSAHSWCCCESFWIGDCWQILWLLSSSPFAEAFESRDSAVFLTA